MKSINVYLGFAGKCREAMNFYKECLGGGELELQSVGESPVADQMPANMDKKQILHSTLIKDGITIMGSDMHRGKPTNGNLIGICVNCGSAEEIKSLFTKLSEGGTIDDPLKEQFWGDTFGAVTDKYGKPWMFNYTKNQH
ncbi:MAG: VOC family protein [Bacteroidota bacterium]|nr:VOC family protein [Bacteroidota bacterium]